MRTSREKWRSRRGWRAEARILTGAASSTTPSISSPQSSQECHRMLSSKPGCLLGSEPAAGGGRMALSNRLGSTGLPTSSQP